MDSRNGFPTVGTLDKAYCMDSFFERLIARAATVDELLSADFQSLPGQKGDTDLAARRLAAWCLASASGDWGLFSRRLARDGLSFDQVLPKLATVRRNPSAPAPAWIDDARWIVAALERPADANAAEPAIVGQTLPYPFEQLFAPVAAEADALLWSEVEPSVAKRLNASARQHLCLSLLQHLTSFVAPAIYELFDRARKAGTAAAPDTTKETGTSRYDQFVAEMKAGGFRRLFDAKPVLLRLIAVMTRQWIDTTRELVQRLDADLADIRCDISGPSPSTESAVAKIEGDLSDPHNGGRSVKIVSFEDGSKAVYKPKDLRVDVAWFDLVERLNRSGCPVTLRAARAISRDGYGWTEFVDHTGCANEDDCERFFRRAGALLALFHCFAATDMHQENMIAAGDDPVPIDLEMILQAGAEESKDGDQARGARDAATEILANSVMSVGLLPSYGRSADNAVFAMGGMTADWNSQIKLTWDHINSDAMRPAKSKEIGKTTPNLPYIDGSYAKFKDHIGAFISGFEEYANFLMRETGKAGHGGLFADFVGAPVRKVIRPTRFYYMLLQRLKNHQKMDDGVMWSAQADFIARLAEWEKESDPLWPLQKAERAALVTLNVPHLVSPCDGHEVRDDAGISVPTNALSGLDRARARVADLTEDEIDWQVEVIRQNTSSLTASGGVAAPDATAKTPQPQQPEVSVVDAKESFAAEANRIADELSASAVRRGPSAAWIGLDWLGDAEVFQLVCLGPELYNGVSGISVFLAAHAAVLGRESSAELARAGIAHLRQSLRSRNAARIARSLGIGGATGLGSIVYAMTVMAKSLGDDAMLNDACLAADLFTDDLIAADKHLDVIGGSAGAILALLRLHRDTQSTDVLARAVKCGEYLIGQSRLGPQGLRSWIGQGLGTRALNGMSHGAAGFAFALASLAEATGREDFAEAASECILFENSSYSAERNNWPDWRGTSAPGWPVQWCHGATGIGLSRIAMRKYGGTGHQGAPADIHGALEGVTKAWPGSLDTLCCGTLGSVEFFCEAGTALGRDDLRALATRRLMDVLQRASASGDYRWNSGKRRFNLGLFRGLAGVGYTLLRQIDGSLPNILIWE
jgi:type 2 lantibiotic biosynthesis protein LanM